MQVAAWREGGVNVETYEFAAELQLEHDLISPWQQTQPLVHPVLADPITGAAGSAGE